MRIALIAPIIERIPPKKYGGVERVVRELAEGLIKRGHDVTLFASGDSKTSAKLVSVYPRSIREARINNLYGFNYLTILNIGTAYQMQGQFDLIHDNSGYYSLPIAEMSRTPVLVTYHGPFDMQIRRLFQVFRKPYVVSISKSQVDSVPNINVVGNIYNGLSMEKYPFSSENDGYLLFVGRISQEKGVHYAIETALTLNLPLIIAAKLDPVDIRYFEEYVSPHLSEDIRWIGEVDEEERNRLMSRALCFLHPVTWKEPFGLTLIEAMACGCPVIAFRKGSIPEIIEDGRTGFVVSDVEEMIEAVERVKEISREECRKYALDKFNATVMVDAYEKVYKKVLNLKEGK